MDIVVTIPKSEYKNDDMETEFLLANHSAYQFWSLKRKPKHLKIEDRVYFVKNNKIESSMKVFEIEECTENIYDVTGRVWKSDYTLFLHDLREENFDIKVKGFQGFRYLDKFMEANEYGV